MTQLFEAVKATLNKDLDVHLYADYRDPAKREHPESRRFTLLETVDGQFGSSDVVLADTDSFDEVVAATGFELAVDSDVPETRAPEYAELVLIREMLDPKNLRDRGVPPVEVAR